MDELNSMTFYKSFYEAIEKLEDRQRLKMYDAIFDFQFRGIEPDFESDPEDNILNIIWALILPNIKASNVKKIAGAKGAKARSANKHAKTASQNSKPKKQNENSNTSNIEEEVEEEVEEDIEVDAEEDMSAAAAHDNVLDFYLNNINPIPTPREIELLESYETDTPEELILYAMEKAVDNKARSMGYIKSILNSWKAKGITTLAEAKEEAKGTGEPEPMATVFARVMKKQKEAV